MTALDLDAIRIEFLNLCGSCDAGIPAPCTCSKRDFRPTMLDLVREIERLRAVIAEVGAYADRCAEDGPSGDAPWLAPDLRRILAGEPE